MTDNSISPAISDALNRLSEVYFRPVPRDTLEFIANNAGKCRFRAIVVACLLSALNIGGKKRTRKTVSVGARTFLYFGVSQTTAARGINDLKKLSLVKNTRHHKFASDGNSYTAEYSVGFLDDLSCRMTAKIYWGMLRLEQLKLLTVKELAILFLLNVVRFQKKNFIDIKPDTLSAFNISSREINPTVGRLCHFGILEYVDGCRYEFTFLTINGRYTRPLSSVHNLKQA